jgi:hypothetical protein
MLTPKSGGLHFAEDQAGCALGMAAIARGCRFRPATHPFPKKDRRTLGTEAVWGNWVLQVVARPCACWRFWIPREMRIKDIIAHIFDYHVMTKKNWTLDQLAAWVQSVEPKNCAPAGTIDPELLEELSQWQAARQPRAVNQFPTEEDQRGAVEWQARVSAFTAKHNSRQRRRPSTL